MSYERRVDYVIFYAADLDRCAAFYRDVIGLELTVRGRGYVEFAMEGTKFGLFERTRLGELIGVEPAEPAAGFTAEILFLVEDVDAEAARIRSQGVPILAGPVDRPWGHRTVHLVDPDGHVIELAQEIPRTDRSSPAPFESGPPPPSGRPGPEGTAP